MIWNNRNSANINFIINLSRERIRQPLRIQALEFLRLDGAIGAFFPWQWFVSHIFLPPERDWSGSGFITVSEYLYHSGCLFMHKLKFSKLSCTLEGKTG